METCTELENQYRPDTNNNSPSAITSGMATCVYRLKQGKTAFGVIYLLLFNLFSNLNSPILYIYCFSAVNIVIY